MSPEPLYAMVAANGRCYTVFYRAKASVERPVVQGPDPNVFGGYIYSGIPVVDLRTCRDLNGMNHDVREQRPDHPVHLLTLDQFLQKAQAAGARIYPLRPESFTQLIHDAINESHLRGAMAASHGPQRLKVVERILAPEPVREIRPDID
ncbi:MAG: hypothetical protein PHE83_16760 [Opitutaceae bacterium]|nr:hypothetical protein [Opitutaceae bacterium]